MTKYIQMIRAHAVPERNINTAADGKHKKGQRYDKQRSSLKIL